MSVQPPSPTPPELPSEEASITRSLWPTLTPASAPARPAPEGRIGPVLEARGPSGAPRAAASESAGIDLGDIYYALFRHKAKILWCTLAGALAAATYFFLVKPTYVSETKLFVRYVVTEGGGPMRQANTDTITKSPDMRGETIMESEEQILVSFDLARRVAEAVGPEKILPPKAREGGAIVAAILLRKNLRVDSPKFSSVISILFRHSDSALVQPVLTEVVNQYLKMHVDVHRASGMVGEFLAQETDQLRARLVQTEEELRKANNKAGVISVDEAKQVYSRQITALREQIFSAQAEIAERLAALEEVGKKMPASAPSAAAPDAVEPEVPAAKIEQFRATLGQLDLLRKREQDLLLQFTAENARVKEVRGQISVQEGIKLQLEEEFPKLARAIKPRLVQPEPGLHDSGAAALVDPAAEIARVTALTAKIKVLTTQSDTLRAEVAKVDQLEGTIVELRRKRQLEEANYLRYSASLEQSRINEALGSGKVSNISVIQTPTPPTLESSNMLKMVIGLAGGGIAVGLAWAFAFEMLFDRSVRRPGHLERLQKAPLFISIPRLDQEKRRWFRKKKDAAPAGRTDAGAATAESAAGAASVTITAGVQSAAATATLAAMHPYHETLRDRLVSYFESRAMAHKPKLVAVTGLGNRSGVTTIAAGLAESLSETGEGNVLLVDMTSSQGSAQQFMKGKAICGLDDLLTARDSAHVQENLYVVTDASNSERLSRNLPLRFTKLVPKLKASNFDYIIFDMPPVSQISITPRLASFMDMVLLVIESEKVDRDVVQRATELLAGSTAHLGTVLNKSRSYVPPRLLQEFPSGA